MWPFRFLFAVGVLSLAAPCSADLILTLHTYRQDRLCDASPDHLYVDR